ncbi:MAG TPA: NAD(+) synthase [Firmicutes bacterium]|nr:NAD(+) synthase [Bacillota bacterium]
MTDGFVKVAAGSPKIRVADCAYNGAQVIELMRQAAQQGVKVLCLPELCLTGYTCADLFLQDALLEGAEQALAQVMEATVGLDLLAALGLPVRANNKLYNCAAILHRGKLLGLVPKTHIPNYGEFYEARWFASAGTLEGEVTIPFAGQEGVLLSPDQLFRCAVLPNLTVGVEICEDLWVPAPPSTRLCAAGATLVLNLSASDEVAGKAAYRRDLVAGQSGRLVCGYVYADAGEGESSTDLVFSGHNMVAENGVLLAESRFEEGLTVSELDIDRLCYERRRLSTFPPKGPLLPVQEFSLTVEDTELTRPVAPAPFVPQGELDRAERCDEILRLAALGLKQRLEHTRARCALIGLSGGLDSTLAILIAAMAFDLLGRAREEILAVTMPCFGTTVRTRSNAEQLAQQLGARLLTVDIGEAVSRHFDDIGQSMRDHSITYENSQARERTQVLMDLANQREGLVVGTGDLSELALGWCTYNGDHMSMYAVNASIPKTLVRHLVAFVADELGGELGRVLWDILDTPVSPELLPPQDGEIAQRTEELVGPYELHDFFLYYAIRWGFPPRKVLRLAQQAFADRYDRAALLKWMERFYRRFFAQQFKRSCLPDGPKVGTLTLSPRGDWRMPSDGAASLWLEQLKRL